MVAVAWTENTLSGLMDTAAPVQFTFQIMESTGRFDIPAGADADNVIGILQNKPIQFSASGANKVGLVQFGGGSKLLVDGTVAIAAGDPLSNDAAGKGVKAATADRIHAVALEAAAADNLVISVLIVRGTMK